MLSESVAVEKHSREAKPVIQASGQSERRRFSLLDLCILIAAIALGLSVEVSQDFRNWSLSKNVFRESVRLH
jgi:hypothetical protein